MRPDPFVRRLVRAESGAVARVMAFMSYNPAIGRVLQRGGVKKFERVATQLVRGLAKVGGQRDFDRLHRRFVERILKTFRTNRGGKPSYGQAAKPINVFLKLYVDWARRPDPRTSRRVVRYLHVPLDSVLMGRVKAKYPGWYDRAIRPHVRGEAFPHSLSLVDREVYWKWQKYFRARWPKKPLVFDIAWAIYRDAS